jgi:CTD small phosphatase-like protein 2
MAFRQIYRKPLKLLSKSNSRNTTPARRREGNFKPVPPSEPKLQTEKENKETVFMINLEDILIIEESLSFILESFHNISEVLKTCEKLWELTADNTLNQIFSLYKDDRKRSLIRKSIVLQSLSISLGLYLFSSLKSNSELSSLLRAIFYYNHQGFLVLAKFISLRLPDDSENIWIQKLTNLVDKRLNKKKTSDIEKLLGYYNKAISANLKKVCRNFGFRGEDPVFHSLKSKIIQILRDRESQPVPVRKSIEILFGNPRESIVLKGQVEVPYLPGLKVEKYTLVLDLDETLVHYIETEDNGTYLTRPFLENFLKEMKKFYEIVVFTAAVQDYADWILDDFDRQRMVDFRLYRQHTIPAGNLFLKDLNAIGRDLARVIIIDNVAENFQLQPENGILIKSWYDDAQDNALKELMPILVQIVDSQMDVRDALKIFREQMLEQLSQGVESLSLCLNK